MSVRARCGVRATSGGSTLVIAAFRLVGCAPVVATFIAAVTMASANEVVVVSASSDCTAKSVCSFRVTLKHADLGRKHYADRFEVLSLDGKVLATRILAHPHVHEQPVTRQLAGVEVPPDVSKVRIRAHDSVHGYGESVVELTLERKPPGGAADP